MSDITFTDDWNVSAFTGFVRDGHENPVASLYGEKGNPALDDTTIARSYLVGAAPAMYAALKSIIADMGPEPGFINAKNQRLAREAIAKVERYKGGIAAVDQLNADLKALDAIL